MLTRSGGLAVRYAAQRRGDGDAGRVETHLALRKGRGDALQALRCSTERHICPRVSLLAPPRGAHVF